MLNYGISKCSGNYILIISAHCIPCDELLIENLLRPFSLNKKYVQVMQDKHHLILAMI